MVASPDAKLMTPQEYLEWEEHQDIKYEYINGEVFAMTEGTIPHNTIALNLASALKSHLRGSSCRAFRDFQQINYPILWGGRLARP